MAPPGLGLAVREVCEPERTAPAAAPPTAAVSQAGSFSRGDVVDGEFGTLYESAPETPSRAISFASYSVFSTTKLSGSIPAFLKRSSSRRSSW